MRTVAACCAALAVSASAGSPSPSLAQCDPVAGDGYGRMDPATIPKFVDPLVIPPAMPPVNTPSGPEGVVHYEIAARQLDQTVLPSICGVQTTVWGYGSPDAPGTFSYPGFTVEGHTNQTLRVRWLNELVDDAGFHLPHLLPVDTTLHWAAPERRTPQSPNGAASLPPRIIADGGPVPIVTHVHGAHVASHSDGGPEQWWLPFARGLPGHYEHRGPHYATQGPARPGGAVYEYDQSQRASTLWYHDHALGITRLNVYAGLAGFWIIRDGEEASMNLPGPAPGVGDSPFGTYFEVPLAIQDRTFKADGDLFYPPDRAFFDGYAGPFTDGEALLPPPVWNPEFFGDAMVVNGRTWPRLDVEPRRYRFRVLNGSNARFLILRLEAGALPPPTLWQIGNEGGFLDTPDDAPLQVPYLLLAPAERADVIVDFAGYESTQVHLVNLGPDAPFGGLPADFDPEDPAFWGEDAPSPETRAVMRFDVAATATGPDTSADPVAGEPVLPDAGALGGSDHARWLVLAELVDPVADVPVAARLGTYGEGPQRYADDVTETIGFNDVEEWNLMNFTEDAHPIHLHLVQFEVVGRYALDEACAPGSESRPLDPAECKGAELPSSVHPWESGFKDTVIANPEEITVVKARFDKLGWYVWHCHIVEHEDNEMMRPLVVQ